MNLFPALLVAPDSTLYSTVRVVDRGAGRVAVYRWDRETRDAVLAAEGSIVEVRRNATWTLTDDDGADWSIQRQGGCGCGHPLKHWRPSRPARVST